MSYHQTRFLPLDKNLVLWYNKHVKEAYEPKKEAYEPKMEMEVVYSEKKSAKII